MQPRRLFKLPCAGSLGLASDPAARWVEVLVPEISNSTISLSLVKVP